MMIGNGYVQFRLHRGIIESRFVRKIFWDENKAKVFIKICRRLSREGKCPLLLDVKKIVGISQPAREYLAAQQGIHLSACAVLIDSILGKFVCQFFIRVNKPKLPVRIFRDRIKAMSWLNQFNPPAVSLGTKNAKLLSTENH